MSTRNVGKGCKMFFEIPSLTPLANHCNRGTRTKSAIEGFGVLAIQPEEEVIIL